MGNPDGGWYDETPPKVLGATPADKATDVKAQKVKISFDEFVKIDNPALRQDLSMMRSQLVRRLNAEVGSQVITDVRVY